MGKSRVEIIFNSCSIEKKKYKLAINKIVELASYKAQLLTFFRTYRINMLIHIFKKKKKERKKRTSEPC